MPDGNVSGKARRADLPRERGSLIRSSVTRGAVAMDIDPLSRRSFLGRAVALGAGFSLWHAGCASLSPNPRELVSRRLFFVQPDYSNVRLSPGGAHLAYLAPVDGVRNLFVAPAAEPRAGPAGHTRHGSRHRLLVRMGVHRPSHRVLSGARRGRELARFERGHRDWSRHGADAGARRALLSSRK
jgi:hypothetical protein